MAAYWMLVFVHGHAKLGLLPLRHENLSFPLNYTPPSSPNSVDFKECD